MIPEKIREINNPYHPITHRIPSSDFIGRKREQDYVFSMLDDYKKNSILSNVVVSGEKSIGKSTLLNEYKKQFEDHQFLVVEIELSRDKDNEINEFEFFKELMEALILKIQLKHAKYINEKQINIWKSLTSGSYSHESEFLEREIYFSTQYSNYINGTNVILAYLQLESDFKKILDELILNMGMEVCGIAILIDEFQELGRNTKILDSLRKLSENLTGLSIVGAGLPVFYENPNFEKFCRTAILVRLKKLEKNEIIRMICKPFEKIADYKKYEILRWFDVSSINEIVKRSDGNPLHVKVLCQKMFDRFKGDKARKLISLDRHVMEDVMEYYSQISENSSKIQMSLETLSKDQLNNFSLLYKYSGFSVRAAILLRMAFSPITPHNEEKEKETFFEAFQSLWGFGLFDVSGATSLQEMLNKTTSELSQVQYNFIGDSIDRLYAAYYYEDLTSKKLVSNSEYSFEDMLTIKYGNLLQISGLSAIDNNISVNTSNNELQLFYIPFGKAEDYGTGEQIIEDLDRLINLSSDDKIDNPEKINEIRELSNKYELGFPSYMAEKLELLGFYYVISDLKIKGKRKIVNNLFPVKDFNGIVPSIKKVFNNPGEIFEGLDEYMVEINGIYIY